MLQSAPNISLRVFECLWCSQQLPPAPPFGILGSLTKKQAVVLRPGISQRAQDFIRQWRFFKAGEEEEEEEDEEVSGDGSEGEGEDGSESGDEDEEDDLPSSRDRSPEPRKKQVTPGMDR